MRTRAQDEANYGEGAHLSMTVNVHVSADTAVEITTFPEQGRATVTFKGYRRSTELTLFLGTPQVRELRDLLCDTLTALTDDADSPTHRAGDAGGEVSDRAA